MAKKYQAIETKIHWLTWTIIGVIVFSLITILIVIQPSEKDVFYDSYYSVSTDANFQKKLPRDNKFSFVKTLEDEWFGLTQGLYSLGARDNHLTIVFFGEPSNQASAANIANVYARLYGSDKVSPVIQPSGLYKALGSDGLTLYYYQVGNSAFAGVIDALNDYYEDADIFATALPMVLVLLNNEVVDYAVLSAANIPLQLQNFYTGVLESEAVQDLIN